MCGNHAAISMGTKDKPFFCHKMSAAYKCQPPPKDKKAGQKILQEFTSSMIGMLAPHRPSSLVGAVNPRNAPAMVQKDRKRRTWQTAAWDLPRKRVGNATRATGGKRGAVREESNIGTATPTHTHTHTQRERDKGISSEGPSRSL